MPSTSDYDRVMKKGQRAMESGEIKDLCVNLYGANFTSKDITPAKFKALFKGKIENDEQRMILGQCLDLLELIRVAKECLEKKGAYVTNITGSLKVNPAQKELRENLKAFNSQVEILMERTIKPDDQSLEGWLNGK